jgi:integrase
MGFIERRNGRYRARYRDPLGRQLSETFSRKLDAERFLREVQVDIERGRWLDPSGAQLTLQSWSGEFLSLARRLSPTTQQTYRRDLDKYILPRFGAYRIGRLPTDEIEKWLMDEIEAGIASSSVHRHYRTFRRVLQVAVQKEKILANPFDRVEPPHVPSREMVFLSWKQAIELAEAHRERFRALIYLAVDSGMRWSELIGLRQSRLDLLHRKVRVTDQLVRLDTKQWLRKELKTSASLRSITITPSTSAILAEHVERFAEPGPEGLVFTNNAGHPIMSSSFWNNHFMPLLPLSRPPAHERRARDRGRSSPEGNPDAYGPQLDQRDARPLRSPLPRARRGDRIVVRGTDRSATRCSRDQRHPWRVRKLSAVL